jgi:hypothetical protein
MRYLTSLLFLACSATGVAMQTYEVPEMTSPTRYAVDAKGQRPVPVITAPGHCAWPNLQLLSDGKTLAALIFNDASHGHHSGDVECWLSKDGGKAWKFESAVTQHEPKTIRMNHAAGLAKNGDLIVLTGGWSDQYPKNVSHVRGKYRFATLGPWLSRSPDGGESWWVDKNAFPETTPVGAPGTPFGNFQVAQNGDLCVAVYSTNGPWEKYEKRKFRSFLYRSKDDGKTWGEPAVIGPDSNETTVLHVGQGHWLAAARIGTGVERKDQLILCASIDDGRTWKVKRVMTGYQRVTGNLLKLRDGRVIFSYGERWSAFGQRGVEAMVSADGGESWSAAVRLLDWNGLDGGYPSSIQRADGQVVTAYYSSALPGEVPDSHASYHMGVIAWDPDRTFSQP